MIREDEFVRFIILKKWNRLGGLIRGRLENVWFGVVLEG